MGPDKMKLKELKKLVNLKAKLLSNIFERSCRSQFQTSRKSPIFDHLSENDLGNYTPAKPTFFPGKAVYWALLEGISKQIKVKKTTKKSYIGW